MPSSFWRMFELRSDSRSWIGTSFVLSKWRRLLPLIVRRVRCASERSTIISKCTIISGLGIRIDPDDGKLHGQTPRSATKGDGLHIVIKYKNDNASHTPVPDDEIESRLLMFLNFGIAAGDRYFGNDV